MLFYSFASQHFNQPAQLLRNVFSGLAHGVKSVFGSCLSPGLPEEAPVVKPTVSCVIDSPPGSCSQRQAQADSPGESLCRFCGGLDHPRSVCPARRTRCSFCSRMGHFRSVCERMDRLSKGNPTVSCAAFEGNLASAIIPVELNEFKLSALVDTGSTASYIDSLVSEKLQDFNLLHIH